METFTSLRPILAGLIGITLSVVASVHALSTKREVRAAIGWMGLIWLVPFGGAALYAILGVNRIRRRGGRIRRRMHHLRPDSVVPPLAFGSYRPGPPLPSEAARTASEIERPNLAGLRRTGEEVTGLPLLDGNAIELLVDGDEAYPRMLAAIRGARKSVGLSTYIFDVDEAGELFIEALADAVRRGVEVRVLVDAVGGLYSSPPAVRVLADRDVPVASFLKSLVPWKAPYFNLRSHRKILVVDGRTAFTGGMNIRAGCLASAAPAHRVRDVHFRVEGPVVCQPVESFAGDWAFTTGERLEGDAWFPELEPAGRIAARGISDGPDEDFESLRWTLLGALASAEERVRIVTPYFLPDQTLVAALNLAALRGVAVDIVIPEVNNLRVVGWAMMGQIRQVLKFGCRVWLMPPPFDHSKLMVVDHEWALFGSGNWDPRSLRLNFEYNVEAYDDDFASVIETAAWRRIEEARRLTIEEVDSWSMLTRLRNSIAWLGSPYL